MEARSLSMAFVLVAACGPAPEEHIDRLVFADGPEPAACSNSWLARDGDALVRFDGVAGEVLARVAAAELLDLTADAERALVLAPHDAFVHVVEHDLQLGLDHGRVVARAMIGDRVAS